MWDDEKLLVVDKSRRRSASRIKRLRKSGTAKPCSPRPRAIDVAEVRAAVRGGRSCFALVQEGQGLARIMRMVVELASHNLAITLDGCKRLT